MSTPQEFLKNAGVNMGVVEGQTLARGNYQIDCDVCIIGSGAGGAVTAALLQKSGKSVVVIEEGGYFTKDRFRTREDEGMPYLYQEGGQRTTKDLGISILQGKAVGGTTVINWTTCFRTPDETVDLWHEKHDVKGFTKADLQPHFDAIEQRLSIHKVPLSEINANNRTLYDGCVKSQFEVDTTSRNVKECAQTGSCGLGCPVDAKQSMLVTYLPDAMKAGAVVISRCKADRFIYQTGSSTSISQIASVEAHCLDAFGLAETGAQIQIRAKTYILSAGAINGPALLLRSKTPDPHTRIGKRTFLHPVVGSIAQFPEKVLGFYGAPQSIASHHFAHKERRGDEVGYFFEVAPMQPMLMSLAMPSLGKDHRRFMELLPYLSAHIALLIDGHHDEEMGGTVTLHESGYPILDYPILPRIWRAAREAQKHLAALGLAAGATAVFTGHDPTCEMRSLADIAKINTLPYDVNKVPLFTAHQMGGCGMSDDPKKGFVRSQDLRSHSVENLYVMDGSVFPTSLGVNPQESVYGLAHLMATRLAKS